MSDLLISTIDGTRTIALNRPAKRNALSLALQEALVSALTAADQDDAVHAVVLTGTDPAFCAGVDFTDTSRFADRYANRFRADPARALRAMRTPVVCAVNGACVSGGLEVALSASFVVASERARFADTHALLDVVPTWGLTALLPRAVGVRMAREMSLTGRFVPAAEAFEHGLVNHVVPHAELLPFARRLAAEIATTSAVAPVLGLYARSADLSLAAALELEADTAHSRPLDPSAFAELGKAVTAR